MRFPDSAGLLLTILDGFIQNEEMMVQSIDNYHYPFGNFMEKTQADDLTLTDIDDCIRVPRLYIIAGHKDKVLCVEQAWRTKITKAFEQLLQNVQINVQILDKINKNFKKVKSYCLESLYWLYLSELVTAGCVQYPREMKIENGDLGILIYYWTPNPSDNPLDRVEQTISFWRYREQPTLKGYQCLNRSFILRNIIGRKVLATIPDREGDWGLVLEGGLFLPLANDFEAGLCKLNSSHISQWTVGEVEEILLNPVYAFGYYYQHIDLVCEWFYVFLYGLATIDENELATVDLEILYQHFCDYIGKHICPYILIKNKIIEMNKFIAVLKITLEDIRKYLKGKEETGISKNIFLMMRNRHTYLPVVHQFIHRKFGLDIVNTTCSITLDVSYWKNKLDNLTKVMESNKKGKVLENLAQYFLGTIPGLKVTAVRAKRGREEVDIFCCNISCDSYLWKLGALILIECKNRKKKVEVSDIRNMVPIMEAKGIHGAMIFSRVGFSSVAIDEIKHQLFGGKMIIPIYLKELEGVGHEKSAYDLLREKIDYSEKIMENDSRQLYF
ncbi:restriction endonuclease [Hydrogenispora ethanolica]|uniref:Restriction endonuclease n=1 Tax=Hydrogenispora ethanolica TaxID=1082276 RepID=A0A4R1QTZ8_HYDET|nr:restriction endonuclease [Hydrogenispora ethanolica]TCL53610.1 restriction endonuclease [Hydrogenispora ethanolica]